MVFNLFILAFIGYQEPWGKDALLAKKPNTNESLSSKKDYGSYLSENIILFHQNVLSPIDGPRSHFRPTSARYALIAIRRYGPLKGILMGCDRLLRENSDPWVYRTKVINNVEYKWDPTIR